MRIALMSGAFINAGDYLITERCLSLLKANFPNAEITVLKRNIPYDDRINELNRFDIIIFGGGPLFQSGLYPSRMPFVSNLAHLKVPVVIMGGGWKGRYISSAKKLSETNLDDKMELFLKEIMKTSSIPFSCRDIYTEEMLGSYGFTDVCMTGCPAWYDLEYIGKKKEIHACKNIRKICISDPASIYNIRYLDTVITEMRDIYPDALITVVFHSLIPKGSRSYRCVVKMSKRNELEYVNISGSADGFKIYNDCDLHIGFRVHAHIYNLSRGNRSILINEDTRGRGVNDSLGIHNIDLPVIPMRTANSYIKKQMYSGHYLKQIIRDYIAFLEATDCEQYNTASLRIEKYYADMKEWLNMLTSLR